MNSTGWKSDSSDFRILHGSVRVLYQFLFTVLLIIASPFLAFKMLRRGHWREGFGQRFGLYENKKLKPPEGRQTLWINAVSVGEVNLTARLAKLLADSLPDITLVVTTTTTTGMAELQRQLPESVVKLYYPIDQQSVVRRAFQHIRPTAVILIEADFWPNLLWEAQSRQIPVILVNALISERAARRYRRTRFLFRPLFASIDRVFCASQEDGERLTTLGVRSPAIRVVGHPKFDTAFPTGEDPLDVRSILNRIGLPGEATILLGGSTHSPEEMILARIYLELRATHPNLFLILVPRHFERAGEVARELRALDIKPILRTDLPESPLTLAQSPHCLILDTTGELRHFYREADIVFIGESFVDGGGQNPIEPAVCGKAIVTGPKMETFKAILPRFLEVDALCQVQTPEELKATITRLLEDSDERGTMSRRAREVVEQNRGALARTAEGIVEGLRKRRNLPPPPVI